MAPKSNQKVAAETVEQMTKNGTEAMKSGFETMTKAYERFTGLGKDNVEAFMQSATAWTKAFERINGEVFAFQKQQIEDGVAAFKAVAGSKSLHEAWEVQSDFAKSALDAYVAQTTKINDLVIGAAKQAAEPFSERLAAFKEAVQEVSTVTPFSRAAAE